MHRSRVGLSRDTWLVPDHTPAAKCAAAKCAAAASLTRSLASGWPGNSGSNRGELAVVADEQQDRTGEMGGLAATRGASGTV